MKSFFCCIFACINIFLRTFVLLKFYEYFILTTFIAAPILSYWAMFGISMLIYLMTKEIKLDIEIDTDVKNISEILNKSIGLTIGYLIIWGIGYIMSFGI